MLQPREPRKHRLQYHHFIKDEEYITIDVQFSQNLQSIPKRVLSKLRKADHKGNIIFHGQQWNAFRMDIISQNILVWTIPKGLVIENSKQSNLMMQIRNIDLSSLINLNLSGNGLESIQPICQMKLPNLQRLVLSNNKIHRINALRKSNFPRLVSCCLAGNRISEYCSLSEIKAPLLKNISQERRADNGWSDTFSWIGKLQTNELQKLWVPSDKRIWQRSAQISFERKYIKRKQITFYVGFVNGVR